MNVNLMSINVNSKGKYCLGWENALGALATQNNMIFLGDYTRVDTCYHYQFCFALQMRHSCISFGAKTKVQILIFIIFIAKRIFVPKKNFA